MMIDKCVGKSICVYIKYNNNKKEEKFPFISKLHFFCGGKRLLGGETRVLAEEEKKIK